MACSTIRTVFSSEVNTLTLRACRAFVPASIRDLHQSAGKHDPNPMPRLNSSSTDLHKRLETDCQGASSNSQDIKWQMFHTTKRLDDEVAVVDQRIHSLDTKTNDTVRGLRIQMNSWIRYAIGAGVATFGLVLYTSDKNLRELDELEERLDRKHAALDIRIHHLEDEYQQAQNQPRV
ncbi:hypothetical protein BJ165DRAFT_398339 [Panaeolus papilionaceus]|nr:hypothetical protein BJ165DRAFT_398339 [Panaeolus papilionaceus]